MEDEETGKNEGGRKNVERHEDRCEWGCFYSMVASSSVVQVVNPLAMAASAVIATMDITEIMERLLHVLVVVDVIIRMFVIISSIY